MSPWAEGRLDDGQCWTLAKEAKIQMYGAEVKMKHLHTSKVHYSSVPDNPAVRTAAAITASLIFILLLLVAAGAVSWKSPQTETINPW